MCLDARLPGGSAGGVLQAIIGMASGLASLEDGDESYFFLAYRGEHDWLDPYLGERCQILLCGDRPPSKRRVEDRFLTRLPRLREGVGRLRRRMERVAWRIRPVDYSVPPSDGTIERAAIDVMHFTKQAGFLTDIPSVYNPHDLQHLHLPENFGPREIRWREVTFRRLCEQAAAVGVTSAWGKQDLVEHYGLPPEKVRVLHWAPVTASYPEPDPESLAAVARRLRLPDGFVFYPAQTWPHKNHLRLLEALARLRDRDGLRVPLVCSGHRNPIHFPAIERRAAALGLSEQVRFLGFVTPLELQCLYALCRGVVIPTLFEAASYPLWEAFLAGAPAACSNVTSLPGQAGDAALVFEGTDVDAIAAAIRRLWTEPELRQRLVDAGRANVARFTWEKTARHYRALYREIAGRPLCEADRALLSAPPLL